VPFVHRPAGWRHARPWLSAVAVVALMLAALAGPALAQGGSPSLRDPWVSPRVARTTATVAFGVTFRSRDDRPAADVRILIDGQARTMKRVASASDATHDVRYAFATKLAVGRHRIRFEATDADGAHLSKDGGWVWVKATASTPKPGPGSGSSAGSGGGPGSKPAGSGASKPEGGGASKPATDHDSPTGKDASDTARGGSPTKSDTGVSHASDATTRSTRDPATSGAAHDGPTTPDVGGSPDGLDIDPDQAPGAVADIQASGTPDASPDPVVVLGAFSLDGAGPTDRSGGTGQGEPEAPQGLESLGVGGGFDRLIRAESVLVTTGGTAAVWAAFIVFGKRRRDGEPPAPDAVLAAHAAAGIAPVAAAGLVPVVPARHLPPGVEPDEADLPRWRRPSLLQARKMDPLRSATVATSLSFADAASGSSGPADGAERRRIRYRLVRLLDVPDEAIGRELTVLDAGDEVQIVESYGIYRLVVCPDGVRGWLHKMVLGDLVEPDPFDEQAPDGIDEDVLSAFLAARRQTA
jgi:hypothetical protein